jgi:hypothetical protein
MVKWESKADRGGRSPIRARSRGGGPHTKPPSTRKKCNSLLAKPHYGTVASHIGQLVPRAGSLAYWAPRLAVHPSVHEIPRTVRSSSGAVLTKPCKSVSLASQRLIRLPMTGGSPLIRVFRPGKDLLGSRTFIVAEGSPTRAPSSCRRTSMSEQSIATTVDTLVFRKGTRTSYT